MIDVTVLTAVLPAASAHLRDAWASVAAQQLPPGRRLEWVVQIDGPGSLAQRLPDDARIMPATSGARFGAATTRNLGLARARGAIVRVLDADDLLTPGQLARELAVLDAHPATAWLTSSAVDLLADGAIRPVGTDPPAGPLARGSLTAHWRANDHRLPVHPASLAVRADICRALGGWAALPTSEDTSLLLALDLLVDGWFLTEPGLVHRRWAAQTTNGTTHTDAAHRALRIAAIESRLGAIERLLAGRGELRESGPRP